MGNLRVFAALVISLVACGGDSNGSPDAQKSADASKVDAPKAIDAAPTVDAKSFDLTCLGSANPTTTTVANITVSGTADGIVGTNIKPVANFAVTLVENGSDVQTVKSDGSGNFSFAALPTDGSALDISLTSVGSGSGDRSNLVFPAAPLVANQAGVPVLDINDSALSELSLIVPGGSADPADGVFVFQASDCAGAVIGGATITIAEGGSNVGNVIDVGSLLPALNGTYVGVNVPPGTVTVTTVVEGHTFRTRSLPSAAETNTLTQIKP